MFRFQFLFFHHRFTFPLQILMFSLSPSLFRFVWHASHVVCYDVKPYLVASENVSHSPLKRRSQNLTSSRTSRRTSRWGRRRSSGTEITKHVQQWKWQQNWQDCLYTKKEQQQTMPTRKIFFSLANMTGSKLIRRQPGMRPACLTAGWMTSQPNPLQQSPPTDNQKTTTKLLDNDFYKFQTEAQENEGSLQNPQMLASMLHMYRSISRPRVYTLKKWNIGF